MANKKQGTENKVAQSTLSFDIVLFLQSGLVFNPQNPKVKKGGKLIEYNKSKEKGNLHKTKCVTCNKTRIDLIQQKQRVIPSQKEPCKLIKQLNICKSLALEIQRYTVYQTKMKVFKVFWENQYNKTKR